MLSPIMLPVTPVKIYLFSVPLVADGWTTICLLGKHVASLVKDGRVGAGFKTFLEQDCLHCSFACMCGCLVACRETWTCA